MRRLLPSATFLIVLAGDVFRLASATPAAATPLVTWRELATPLRAEHALVYDTRRDQALMLGGDRDDRQIPAENMWRLVRTGVPRWVPFATTGGGPLPRSGMAAVYDSLRDCVLVFGGRADWEGVTGSDELWQLSLGGTPTWTLFTPAPGPAPSARHGATMVIDANDRLVLFGGSGPPAQDSSVWILPLATDPPAWQEFALTGAGPGPRRRHGAVYSPETHRMTVFGGEFEDGNPYGDYTHRKAETWELVLDDPIHWIPRASAPSDTVPPREVGGAFVADRAGNHAWLITGKQPDFVTERSVWHLDLQTQQWSRVTGLATGPAARTFTGGCLVPSTGEVLIQGGVDVQGLFTLWNPFGWALTTSGAPAWVKVVDATSGVSARLELDAQTGRLLQAESNGLWVCDVANGSWSLDPAAAIPLPAGSSSLSTLDPVNRRLLIAVRLSSGASELRSRSLDAPGPWSSTPITGAQPVGTLVPTVFDPAGQRMLYLQPFRNGFAKNDTVHTLEVGDGTPEWVPIAIPGTAPVSRTGAAFAWDAMREKLHMAGGYTNDLGGTSTYQLWTLDLSGTPSWQLKIPTDYIHGPVNRSAYMIDPTLDRGVDFAGVGAIASSIGNFNRVIMTGLASANAWEDLDPDGVSPILASARGFYDPVNHRFLVWNGTLWEVTWPAGVSVPPSRKPTRFALSAIRPNPARDQVMLELASPTDADVTAELFDVSGRRIGELLRRRVSAGNGSYPARLTRGLAPGVYLVRASDGTNTAHARVAVLH